MRLIETCLSCSPAPASAFSTDCRASSSSRSRFLGRSRSRLFSSRDHFLHSTFSLIFAHRIFLRFVTLSSLLRSSDALLPRAKSRIHWPYFFSKFRLQQRPISKLLPGDMSLSPHARCRLRSNRAINRSWACANLAGMVPTPELSLSVPPIYS